MKSAVVVSENLGSSIEMKKVEDRFFQVVRFASLILTALIFFLISLGGLVRNAGAGLSCPDWPLCFGRVVPPMDYQVFLEWFHRLIAGSVSVLVLGLAGLVFFSRSIHKKYAAKKSKLKKLFALALSLLGAQIILGGLTVLGLLNPKWVSSHLAVGMAFFGTMTWTTLLIWNSEPQSAFFIDQKSGLFRSATLAACAVYFQIILGGLVSSNYAGLACPDFPTCNGLWLPSFEGLVRFQILHRLGALIAAISIGVYLLYASENPLLSKRAARASRAVSFFLAIQIALGIGSVLFRLPLLMSVAHLATAALLFASLLVVNYELRHG